jgi:hypothetical protein
MNIYQSTLFVAIHFLILSFTLIKFMRFNFLPTFLLMSMAFLALVSMAQAQESFFTPVSTAQGRLAANVRAIPNAKLYKINEAGLRNALANTAKEDERGKPAATIAIPLPDGTTERFALRETQVMSPELAAANPSIKTYEGEGTVHKNYIIRMSLSIMGFEALIWGVGNDAVYFARVKTDSGSDLYRSYYARDARKVGAVNSPIGDHHCGTIGTTDNMGLPGLKIDSKGLRTPASTSQISYGANVRTFRIAIATTGEWARNAAGVDPTNPTETPLLIRQRAYAVVLTAINRVNGIYTRELGCRFQNVNPNLNNEQTNLIFDNPATDPYDNTDNAKAPNNQLAINQTTLDNRVASANYDVGHLFGTGGGGVASSPSLCALGFKAQGYSARGTDTGDPFVVDYFAHELGHQFGMGHTYNVIDKDGACTTRSAEEAYEVASGSTILSYVGICNSGRNLQQYNDFGVPAFHISSITRATEYLASESFNGVNVAGCGTISTQTNAIPTVSAGSSYTIPRLTPFTLKATGADANAGEVANLLYSWEEYDLAPANGATGFGGTPSGVFDTDEDGVARPILRAYSPVASAQRTFPSTAFILNPQNNATPGENQPMFTYTGTHPTGFPGATCPTGQTCIIGERLPTIARVMNFRVSVRDQRGGVSDAGTSVTIVNTPGAFRLTSFDNASAVAGNSQQTVTWNVVGTNEAPISCANVAIKLSTDGGVTFPTTLLASTANDGSEVVVIPNDVTTSTARLRVEAVDNIFFDISNANFSITPVTATAPVATANNNQTATVGQAFTYTVNAFTGTAPITYSASGLPDGLTFNADSRLVSGTPTTSGTSTLTITGTNSTGQAMTSFAIAVNPAPVQPTAPVATANNDQTATVGQAFTYTVNAFTGTQPITYSASGLPDGLTFNADSRLISGTPTTSGTSTLTITGTNSAGQARTSFAITVNPAPMQTATFSITSVTTVSCTTLSAGERRLTFNPRYAGDNGSPVSFSVVNEMLPTTSPGPYTLRVYTDNPTITLSAVQSGTASTFAYNWLDMCTGSPTPPPNPPSGTFSITGVTTVSCTMVSAGERRLTFNPRYAGDNGSPVSFSVVNEMLPTTSPGPYTLRVYTDNPTITLSAVQSGTASTFAYNWLAACNENRTRAGVTAEIPLRVTVLGNPVSGTELSVEIRGAEGQPLRLSLTSASGKLVGEQRVEQAGIIERQSLNVTHQPVGVLLLQVSTPTQSRIIKVLRGE